MRKNIDDQSDVDLTAMNDVITDQGMCIALSKATILKAPGVNEMSSEVLKGAVYK